MLKRLSIIGIVVAVVLLSYAAEAQEIVSADLP